MPDDQKIIKKVLGSKITLFVLLLGFIWLSVQLADVYYRKYKINKEIEDLKTQIAGAQNSNKQISAMLDYLGSKEFLEKEAREKLNMKREGEEVVIVEPPKNLATSAPEIPAQTEPQNVVLPGQLEEKPKEDSNFVKWWRYFFQ